jgi:hypothetical protein
MIKNLELQNFKGFERLDLSGLKTLNVITGPNASGKTALLEALFVGTRALPQAITMLNDFRGINIFPTVPTGPFAPVSFPFYSPASFRTQWDHLFFEGDTQKHVTIKYSTSEGKKREVNFYYGASAESQLQWWCSWASRSRLEPFRTLAKTVRQHWEGYFDTGLTSAAIEAVNGIIQLAKRMARGFKNFVYFRTAAYLRAGRLKFELPAIN